MNERKSLSATPATNPNMPSFQVYLPPTLVDLNEISASHLPISFRTIPRSLSLESQSQSQRQSSSLHRESFLGRLLVDRSTAVDRKGKRKAVTVDLDESASPAIFIDRHLARNAVDIGKNHEESLDEGRIWGITRQKPELEEKRLDVNTIHDSKLEIGIVHAPSPSSPTQGSQPTPPPPRHNINRSIGKMPMNGTAADSSRRQSKRLKTTGKSNLPI